MNRPAAPKSPLDFHRWPWLCLAICALTLCLQLVPGSRAWFVYDRTAVAGGDWWRLWTGHLVHFGWLHWLADTVLWLALGWVLHARHRHFYLLGLGFMPLFISGVIFWAEPGLLRYGGLSAVNFGLLLYLALQGWRRQWTDWFWPAVLAVYVAEVVFELLQDGRGGGLIRFDEPGIRIATGAHLAGAAYALLAAGWTWLRRPRAAPCHGEV